jgi:tol-pal system protein YbgF
MKNVSLKITSVRTVRALCVLTALITIIAFAAPAAAASKARRGSAESEAILPQIDVIQVKESSDEALRTSRDMKRENEALIAKITQLDNRLLLLSEEVANFTYAKVEELETRLALLTEAFKDMYVKIQALEDFVERSRPKPPPPPAKPVPNNATFTPSAAAGDVLLASPEYDLYQSGLRLFNGRSYDRAIKTFEECLAKFPDGTYKDNAQYWIGECLYQQAKMEAAIEAYKKVFSYPNSPKADAAQFKIALALQKMGQTERAKAEFRRLIERYPASDFVERAKKYVAELK